MTQLCNFMDSLQLRKQKKVDDLEKGYTGVAQQSPRDVNKSQELQNLSKRKPYMD